MRAASHIFVGFLALLNAFGGATQAISLNWWLYSYQSDTMGPYPVLVLSSAIYVIGFGIALGFIWARNYSGEISFVSLLGTPPSVSSLFQSPVWMLICIGFNDAFNGVLMVSAAPPDRTPPVLGTMMISSSIVFAILISRYYLHETKSISSDALVAVLLSLTSVYVSIMPSLSGDTTQGEPLKQVLFWCFITLLGMIPGTLYNAQQQKFVVQSREKLDRMKQVLINNRKADQHQQSNHVNQVLLSSDETADATITYWAEVHLNMFTLFWGCLFQLIFMGFFFWIMLINIPSLNWNGCTVGQLGQQLVDGFGCFFGGGAPTCLRGKNTLYGLIFNLAYFTGYIASIYLNLISLPLSMISNQLQGPLSAIILLIIPSLDLNPTGAQAYSVLPALILQLASMWVYELSRTRQLQQEEQQQQNYGSKEFYGNA